MRLSGNRWAQSTGKISLKTDNASYHLVGIAGVGMSALAQVLLAKDCKVSGSDRYLDRAQELPGANPADTGLRSGESVLDKLRRAGVALLAQDGAGVRAETTGVVISTAIEADNPDLAAARRLGVPVIHRAAMLARLARSAGATTITVTGTAGKTTVTGMIGWVLEQLGLDPMVVNGGALLNWVTDAAIGNVRIGRGATWVLEVDESDRSLLQFDPDWAVITNISKDHFELDEVQRLFQEFARKVRRGVIGCYGVPPPAGFQPRLSARGCGFNYQDVAFEIPMLGRHNAENALHCVQLCERLGLALPAVSRALSTFRGIQRRLEWAGKAKGVTVIDDYAHNPVKITAAWQAVAPHFKRVIAVWRPHGYAPLALMMEELTRSFAAVIRDADRLLILPVYYAGGTAQATVDSSQLVARLVHAGAAAETADGYAGLQARLLALARPGDVILLMGARDPFLPVFARRLVLELEHFLVDRVP